MEHIFTVTFPDIGEGVVEGEVIEWLKNENDFVEKDEPIVTVMTDKATVELPSPHAGKLVKKYYQEGELAILDKPLYDLELEKIQKVLATPKTRHLAREEGIDISKVEGTGKDGRLLEEDLKKKTQRLAGDEEIPLIGIRHLMSKKMAESKKMIPHFSFFDKADATLLIDFRKKLKKEGEKENIPVTYMPIFIKALSKVLTYYPEINSTYKDKSIIIHKQHNIGIAMTTEEGLIVPVLKGVHEMPIREVVISYNALIDKAKKKKLEREDMIDGTITISNYGVIGSGATLWATPIINYPEAAILAIAKITKQPTVINGELAVRDIVDISWSFDHRVIDGYMAATFSNHFVSLIQNPATLI